MSNNFEGILDWEYAKQGIMMWLNNDPENAEKHFKNRENSTRVFAGFTFTTVMNAVISYEADRIELAQQMLKELEKRCSNNNNGWIQSFKTKIFGYDTTPQLDENSLEDKIILADSLMCSAILTFLTQDVGGLMRGSWLLRRAWKLYQQLYGQIYELYKVKCKKSTENNHPVTPMDIQPNYCTMVRSQTTILPNNENTENISNYKKSEYNQQQYKNSLRSDESTTAQNLIFPISEKICIKKLVSLQPEDGHSASSSNLSMSQPNVPNDNHPSKKNLYLDISSMPSNAFVHQVPLSCPEPVASPFSRHSPFINSDIDIRTIQRLMGAVSFGYGIFQLSVSLLPHNLLRVISFFGFEGDKNIGISCLSYSKNTEDMRAPLATLALLWYYTIGAQLFHLESANMKDEIMAAKQLLKDSQPQYATSAIFLFFSARLKRLQCNTNIAIDLYDAAYRMSAQRELKLLCLHEVGWCRLIHLDFGNAMLHFHELKLASNFSKSFYTYMTTICQGAFGRFDNLIKLKAEILTLINRTGNKETQIDKFILRRINKFPSTENEENMFAANYWKFFIYEMLFLWNTLYSCPADIIAIIISDCSASEDTLNEPSIGLANLIAGSCKMQLQQFTDAIAEFRMCLRKREGLSEDVHITAFANFELAALLLEQRTASEIMEAKTILQNIRLYKNYDFESRLSARAYAALKTI